MAKMETIVRSESCEGCWRDSRLPSRQPTKAQLLPKERFLTEPMKK